ncbi:MAG: hypothetical protein J6Y11_05590 [Paludibacteraceae bacterium]|nr:hypothetical protein [Paludibacteraceae bacterium]
MGFLADKCTIGLFTEDIIENCKPFTCGKDEDMDEFFRKDVFDYNHGLMSKAYYFFLDEDPSELERMNSPRQLETRLMFKDLLE